MERKNWKFFITKKVSWWFLGYCLAVRVESFFFDIFSHLRWVNWDLRQVLDDDDASKTELQAKKVFPSPIKNATRSSFSWVTQILFECGDKKIKSARGRAASQGNLFLGTYQVSRFLKNSTRQSTKTLKNQVTEGAVFIKIPKDGIKNRKTELTILVYSGDKLIDESETTFLGPGKW